MDLKYIIAQQRRRPQSPSLDIAFALDESYKSRRGPTVSFTRATSGTFVNKNGRIVGKTTSTTPYTPSKIVIGDTVVFDVPSGSVVGWLNGQEVIAHVDTDNNNQVAGENAETLIKGTIVRKTDTSIFLEVFGKGGPEASLISNWSISYRGLRIGYDPITGSCRGALFEDTRTTIIHRSENFSNAVWVKSEDVPVSGGATVTTTLTHSIDNTVIAPDGSFAQKLTVGNTTAKHSLSQTITPALNNTYAWSIFVKPKEISRILLWCGNTAKIPIYKFFDLLGDGTVISTSQDLGINAKIEKFSNGWYRCSVSATATSADSTSIRVSPIHNDSTTNSYTGNGVDSFYVWGAQLEGGYGATSYIKTLDASANRQWDVCTIDSIRFNSFYNSYKSTIFATASDQVVNLTNQSWYQFGSSEQARSAISFIRLPGTGINNTVLYRSRADVVRAVGTDADLTRSAQIIIDNTNTKTLKSAFSVQTDNFALSVNGSVPSKDLAGSIDFDPKIDRLRLGTVVQSSGQSLNGYMSRFIYYPHILTETKLQELTTTTTKRLTYNGVPLLFNDNTINITI